MKYRFIKNSLIVVLVLTLELLMYSLFIAPEIIEWGATKEEFVMEMAGDNDQAKIISTRAIQINAPKETVWKWLMQLGADRGGFYSYAFIEQALGYHTSYPELTEPRFGNLEKGDTVRGSNDESNSVIPYNFKVLHITPEKTFVLENWGTFTLISVNDETTRLVIRTQETKSTALLMILKHQLALPFHFIMERRMLYGFKMKAEASNELGYSRTNDIFWFSGVLLSGCLIFSLMFVLRDALYRIAIPSILGASWLIMVFLFPPLPIYSVILFAVVCLVFFYLLPLKWRENTIRKYSHE